MNITIITPTGDRPESLERQAKYIARSRIPTDAGQLVWIVVDDGQDEFIPSCPIGWFLLHQRSTPRKPDSVPTLIPNLIAGLAEAYKAQSDYVLFWEDDDWHDSERIAHQVETLASLKSEHVYLHGHPSSIYYNAPHRVWRNMGNVSHASMFETAISHEAVQATAAVFQASTGNGCGLDRKLWKELAHYARFSTERHSIGIKGMPGRAGIGCGHRPHEKGWTPDPSGSYLTELVGAGDAEEIMLEGGVS